MTLVKVSPQSRQKYHPGVMPIWVSRCTQVSSRTVTSPPVPRETPDVARSGKFRVQSQHKWLGRGESNARLGVQGPAAYP